MNRKGKRIRRVRLAAGGTALLVLAILSCGTVTDRRDARKDYADILDVKNLPTAPEDWSAFCFSDMGSWQGFALPPDKAKDRYGSFPGPFLMTNGRWLSRALIQFVVLDATTGLPIDLSRAASMRSVFYPGQLSQDYAVDGWRVVLKLIFISSRSVLVSAEVTNESRDAKEIRTGWRGDLLFESASVDIESNAVLISLNERKERLQIEFPADPDLRISTENRRSYQAFSTRTVKLNPAETLKTCLVQSFFLTAEDPGHEAALRENARRRPDAFFEENAGRWNGYLRRIFDTKSVWVQDLAYRKIAVKALLTLMNNWKCARGDLFHDGLFPSYAIRYFNGFWAWDSWKHAAALARFAPEIAKSQIRAMFDYQDPSGMVADCIFAERSENNWRDTKPPLAAWAVREVYRCTHDRDFLGELYPKLLKYHAWWYKCRDHDQNGLCEYGSTDGTRVAAAWESGMDNAIRFDEASMVQNGDQAWSLNQESADLNSYLYAEKIYLAELARALGQKDAAKNFLKDAEPLKTLIRNLKFDDDIGTFFDIRLETKEKIRIEGPEGWIPLWAGVASPAQAAKVRKILLNERKFNTYVPFPTVAADHPKYTKNGYWRGPVWLDQAYFGVKALANYGFIEDARMLTRKLLDHPAGLKDSPAPIRENYDPLTGEGLEANHFSWSSAHYLLLIRED